MIWYGGNLELKPHHGTILQGGVSKCGKLPVAKRRMMAKTLGIYKHFRLKNSNEMGLGKKIHESSWKFRGKEAYFAFKLGWSERKKRICLWIRLRGLIYPQPICYLYSFWNLLFAANNQLSIFLITLVFFPFNFFLNFSSPNYNNHNVQVHFQK